MTDMKLMHPFQVRILGALSRKNPGEVYQGTVPASVKARRRKANKAARAARRNNR